MPHVVTFDTLSYAKKLISVGVPQEQAEVQADIFSEIIESELATKRDIKDNESSLKRDMKELEVLLRRDMKELEVSLKRDMKELETFLKRDLKEIETSLKRDMKELEQRLIIKLGFLIAASIAIVATLVKLL